MRKIVGFPIIEKRLPFHLLVLFGVNINKGAIGEFLFPGLIISGCIQTPVLSASGQLNRSDRWSHLATVEKPYGSTPTRWQERRFTSTGNYDNALAQSPIVLVEIAGTTVHGRLSGRYKTTWGLPRKLNIAVDLATSLSGGDIAIISA